YLLGAAAIALGRHHADCGAYQRAHPARALAVTGRLTLGFILGISRFLIPGRPAYAAGIHPCPDIPCGVLARSRLRFRLGSDAAECADLGVVVLPETKALHPFQAVVGLPRERVLEGHPEDHVVGAKPDRTVGQELPRL